jgi:hypothetical protein
MSKRMEHGRQKAEDEDAIQDYFQNRSTTGLNAIATHPTQGLNRLQGSQARFRAPKPTSRLAGPFARKHNRSKAELLESTIARKHNGSQAQSMARKPKILLFTGRNPPIQSS